MRIPAPWRQECPPPVKRPPAIPSRSGTLHALDLMQGGVTRSSACREGSITMDAALLLSGFSGLVAAFVASALWATRPTALSGSRVTDPLRAHTDQRR